VGADNPSWVLLEAGAARALPAALTLIDQARARKHDTDLGNRRAGYNVLAADGLRGEEDEQA